MTKEEIEYSEFLKEYEKKVSEVASAYHLGYYDAVCSGKQEDYERLEEADMELHEFYMDKEAFIKLKGWMDSGNVNDPILKRQLELQYISFMGSMGDKEKVKEMVSIQTRIEQVFNSYRVKDDGKDITDNEVDAILKTSKDGERLRNIWEQSKAIGREVSEDLIKLVKIRNSYAKDLGFRNFQEMSMRNSELDPEEMEKLFDDLDNATRDIYIEAKNQIDEALAASHGISIEELRPWHYRDRFFQEVPDIFDMDLDKYYSDKDVLAITSDYYARIGMDVSDIVKRSDLYEREGKYQHAMATFIDRKDDVRIVTNIKNDSRWTGTLLHEFGHAAYFKEIDKGLPWELRESGHILTTEAIAIMFQDMIYSPDWMIRAAGLSESEVAEVADRCKEYCRLDKLIFSRWDQVMYRFEKSMYEGPDQDLNALWWQLVEKYQMIRKPEGRNAPDWASKIHIASSPVYYHNYLLGHLYAAQIRRYIADNILRSSEDMPSYIDNDEVGRYLIREIFRPGNMYKWDELIRRSTGKPLGIEDLVKEVE